jgi:peptide deformylase
MKKKIIQAPNPVLRLRSQEVKKFDDNLKSLAREMVDIMDASGGVGLAAPQISSALDLAIIRVDEERVLPLLNSEIVAQEGQEIALEGCLSLPGLSVFVQRASEITIKSQDLEGQEMTVELEGVAARVAQHELDHLRGKLIIDYFWSKNNPSRGDQLTQDLPSSRERRAK